MVVLGMWYCRECKMYNWTHLRQDSYRQCHFTGKLMSNPQRSRSLSLQSLRTDVVQRDQNQPRKKRSAALDDELRKSMKENGLWQPILVRKEGNIYVIIFGERRWEQACALGWETIDCLVTDADSGLACVIQLIENVQREDLSSDDLARHLGVLMEHFKQEDQKTTLKLLATNIGKSIGWVSEKLVLTNLPPAIKALKDENSVKNSRVLIGLSKLHQKDPTAAATLIKEAADSNKRLTVDLINEVRGTTRKKRAQAKEELKIESLPASMQHPKETESVDAAAAPAPAATAAQTVRPKRKKVVADAMKLIGLAEDMPAEEMIEALSLAYLRLKEDSAVAA